MRGGRAVGRKGGSADDESSAGAPTHRHTALPPYRPTALSTLPVTFLGSFPDPRVSLDPVLPEIAFIGRSNVGKSSLLNALMGQPGLARVSATPGKTAYVNVFRLPEFYLVDLPGYGFARASKPVRAGYRVLVDGYLRARESLAGVVWLLDIRHPPSEDDYRLQDLLAEAGRNVLAVFTKADKLGRQAQRTRAAELAASIGIAGDQSLLVSSTTGQGIADLGDSILAAAQGGVA